MLTAAGLPFCCRPTPSCHHTDVHDVSVWRAHNAADKAAAAAAAASDAAEAARAEALLEQQLEQMLDEGADDIAGDGLMDDYVDSDTADGSSDGDNSDSDSGRRRQRQQQQQHAGGKRPKQPQHQQPGTAAATKRGRTGSAAAAAASVAEPPPPSFSQVPIHAPESELRKQYPRFPGLAAASVVVLQAGDMLFLPAGWFHEVTSYGGQGAQAAVLRVGVAACCGLSAATPCQPVRWLRAACLACCVCHSLTQPEDCSACDAALSNSRQRKFPGSSLSVLVLTVDAHVC